MKSNEHYEPRLGRIHMSEYLGRRQGTRVKKGGIGMHDGSSLEFFVPFTSV